MKSTIPFMLLALVGLVSGCSSSNSPTDVVMSEDEVSGAQSGGGAVADPMTQNTVAVTFDINVPFYLSNELKVDLVWGETTLTAKWVAGQIWEAVEDFPSDTVNPLTVTFYDGNGAVELAVYNQDYRVGSNAAETVLITAEQFDDSQFDSDGDGVSNLDELNGGTDPFVNNDSFLRIVEDYSLKDGRGQYSRISVSQIFESAIQQDRPYVDTYVTDGRVQENDGFSLETLFGNYSINIDVDGNGSLEVNTSEAPRRLLPRVSATRTNSGNAISWTGEYAILFDDYAYRETVSNTVAVVDANLRSFVQNASGTNNGTYQFSWETSANLTGQLIEGTSLCEPVAGTFTETRQNNFDSSDLSTTTITTSVTKEMDDEYWRVTTTDARAIAFEYFARKLVILEDSRDADSAFFTCDFVDF